MQEICPSRVLMYLPPHEHVKIFETVTRLVHFPNDDPDFGLLV
jgi:hypothetical protein